MTIPKNILLATDYTDASDSALSAAFDLANAVGATVHLVHVFSLQGTDGANMTRAQISALEEESRRKIEVLASAWRKAGRVGEVRTSHGDPAPMILLAAEELHVDMIVLGTHGRHGLPRLVLGSVAESVLRQAKCPVLIAKSQAPRKPEQEHSSTV